MVETRSIRTRVLSLGAAIALDAALLGLVAIVLEVAAARSSTRQLEDKLRAELARYDVVMVEPGPEGPELASSGPAVTALHRRPRAAAPLEVPRGDLVLQRLEPRFADFVRQNPTLEKLLTDEIARDIQRRKINGRMLDRARIGVQFQVGRGGAVSETRVTLSSGVESVDALAIELATLLERYQILAPLEGLEHVELEIGFQSEVVIELDADAHDSAAAEEIRRRVSNLFGLLRFGMGKEEAAIFLDGVVVQTLGNKLQMRKTFDRRILDDFLGEVYGTPAPHPAAASRPRP